MLFFAMRAANFRRDRAPPSDPMSQAHLLSAVRAIHVDPAALRHAPIYPADDSVAFFSLAFRLCDPRSALRVLVLIGPRRETHTKSLADPGRVRHVAGVNPHVRRQRDSSGR